MANELRKKMRQLEGTQTLKQLFNKNTKKKKKKKKYKEVCHNKKNLKFGNYKRSLEAIQLEHKVKELETSKFNVDSPRENYKEIIKKQ